MGKKILPTLQHHRRPFIRQQDPTLCFPSHHKTILSLLTRLPPSGTQNTDGTPVPHLEAVTGPSSACVQLI